MLPCTANQAEYEGGLKSATEGESQMVAEKRKSAGEGDVLTSHLRAI